jgi:hypothetical protein
MFAPRRSYHVDVPTTSTILPALRELLSNHPTKTTCGPEELRDSLSRYLPRRPEVFEVELAMDALRIEGRMVS